MSSKKKLTLSVDAEVIERARRYSREHDTSISQLVSTYLSQLDSPSDRRLSAWVRRLVGVLPSDVSIEEHREHVEKKHA